MPRDYDPHTWYWLADDDRLFSGATESLIDVNDPAYVEWSTGHLATPWPRDAAGNQTDASLQAVLAPYGKFANLSYYTVDARDRKLVAGVTVNGRPFATDALTVGSLNTAFIYSQSKTTTEFTWKLPDGSYVSLDKAEVTALQIAVAQYGQDCFACEADVIVDIDAGTVTTRDQVDAAFAAVPNSFTGMAVGFNKWQRRK